MPAKINATAFCRNILVAVSIVAGGSAVAVTVISETGTDAFGMNLHGNFIQGVSWTETQTFTSMAITVRLFSNGIADTGTAYLTTQTGAGTTTAQQIATATFTFPTTPSPGTVTLFSGITLGPGTYYLTLKGGSGSADSWQSTASSTITTAAGVTKNTDYTTAAASAYPPASSFSAASSHLVFSVVGVAVPEPGSTVLVLAGLPAVFWRRRRLESRL